MKDDLSMNDCVLPEIVSNNVNQKEVVRENDAVHEKKEGTC